ncbi:hypothetical protein [Acetobacter sp. UBA5411]|uniref:hypothetical protein n=1 Tax=Acetobacter sp. UBA5411 TaxID=1945905 RepID=UPI0025C33B28|nr:hypothetical protein [Acetobacter sp. UBA5411]
MADQVLYYNYILYRTKAMGDQPVGYVVATQLLSSLDGVAVPDGFAFVLDEAKKYPVGSEYMTPA